MTTFRARNLKEGLLVVENAVALSKLADANRKMTLADLLAKAMIELESDDEIDDGIKFVTRVDAVDQYFGL